MILKRGVEKAVNFFAAGRQKVRTIKQGFIERKLTQLYQRKALLLEMGVSLEGEAEALEYNRLLMEIIRLEAQLMEAYKGNHFKY